MDGLLTAEEFPAEFDENRDDGKLYAEYRRLAAEQAALRRVATLVARGVGPLEVFGAVAVEMRRCVSAVTAGLWRFETDGEITIAAAAADSAALARWPVGTRTPLEGNTLAALVQRSGWLARIDSYDNVAGSFAARVRAVDVRSAVGVRIIVDGRVWGLAVGSVQPGPMPADTEVHIGRFAELIATAVVAGIATSRSGSSWLRLAWLRSVRQPFVTSMSETSTRTPPVDSRAIASKNAPASGVVTAATAAS